MTTLREWQQQFLADVVDHDDLRLAIHRNNWRSNLRGALRAGYPVVERLVGADFFNYCADTYIDEHPSRSSNLERYGYEFPLFLREFAAVQALPYLADVAALELAIESLLVTPDEHATIDVCSPFPILRIWQVNQPGGDANVSIHLDAGGDALRVFRADGDVLIEKIGAGAQNSNEC